MLPVTKISVFFNRQIINGLTSDLGFLNMDRNKWKEQGLLIGFWNKFWGK